MKVRAWQRIGGLCVLVLLAFSAVLYVLITVTWFDPKPRMPQPTSNAVYLDKTKPIAVRVADLLAYMTLEEKIGQMALVEKGSLLKQSDIAEFSLGALLSGAGSKPKVNTSEGWKEMIDSFQNEARASRLAIPLLYGADAIHGHAHVPGATIFPHALGLGATHNPELVQKVAEATALEMSATGVNWSFSPNLDQPKDIRWGRVYEAFSDDTALVSDLAVAYLQGLQRPTEGVTSSVFVLATPKHYLGLGGMSWGSSLNTNFKIDQGITKADEELLRSQYLPPFKAVVDAGALSIMAGLNTWGDTRMVFQKKLLTDVLKKELGFRGFVVSDWYGVHEGSRNIFLSTVFAVNAGVDMFMLPFDYVMFVKHMKWANRLGLISDERIDDAVGRILYAKFALSLFDADTRTVAVKEVGKDEHRLLAREAVGQSLVLLKNNDAVLPIQPQVRHIRVAGGSADNVGKQAGAWTVEWQGVDGNWLTDSTTILEGLRENAPKSVNVEFSQDGVFATKSIADIGIAVVGEKPYAEGWGDTQFPILSDEDRLAIANLQKNSKQLIVIVVSGRPLLIEQELRDSDAFVAAWLPGSEGAGVADVLFGRIPFTGTLPLPWPLKAEQLPLGAGDTTADGSVVLFERGFGLR